MSELLTPQRPAAASAADAVALSRRQLWLLVVVTCVPVPALSYAAGIVPLPDLLTRAAVSFVPFLEATTGAGGGSVIRGERVAVESLTIRAGGAVDGGDSQGDRPLGDGRPTGAKFSASAKVAKPALADESEPRGGATESTPTAGVDPAVVDETPTAAEPPDQTADKETPRDRGAADGAGSPVDTAPAPPAPQASPADPTTGKTGPGTKSGGGPAGGADPPEQAGSQTVPGPASPPANAPAAPTDPSPPEQASSPGKPSEAGSQGNGSGGGRP